jgi:hypothetical protein
MPTTHDHITRRRRHGRVLAALAVLASLVPLAGAPAAESDDNFTILGEWRPEAPPGASGDGHIAAGDLYANVGMRRLYFFGGSWLRAYDLDTLRPLGEGVVVTGLATATYVDPVSSDVFIAFVDLSGAIRLDVYGLAPTGMALRSSRALPTLHGKPVFGFHRTGGSDLLWLIAQTRPTFGAAQQVGLTVAELHLGAFYGSGAVPNWAHSLPECAAAVTRTSQSSVPAAMVYRPGSLYFGCGETQAVRQSAVTPRGVGRLSLTGPVAGDRTVPGAFRMFARDGGFSEVRSYADPVTGRLALESEAGSTGASLTVFDTEHEAWIGDISVGGNQVALAGIDPLTGRFYGVAGGSEVGMIASDLRATPVRQGVKSPSFHGYVYDGTKRLTGDGALVSDAATKRLFLKYGNTFLLVRDNIAPYVAPDIGAVDANTNGGPEVPGVTSATYSSLATAYGSRYRQVGGVDALGTNYLTLGSFAYPVAAGTRDVRLATINRITVANDEATASATGGTPDSANTGSDLNSTQPKDPSGAPVATPSGEPVGPLASWPYEVAACADFGNGYSVQDVRGARASCSAREPAVGGYAVQDRSAAEAVAVERSESRADSGLDPRKGTVTVVTASAQGIDVLGGLLRIGKVQVRAEASAHGQRGTTLTSYKRTVEEVKLQGQTLCGDGSDRPCNLKSVQEEVNAGLAGRVMIRFPEPVQSRSPGGYQSLVQQSDAEQAQEVLLNEQAADRREVPAVVITVFHDRTKPSRTIVDLAAVAAEARYGISGADSPGGIEGVAGSAGLPGLPVLGAVEGGSPLFGLAPAAAPTTARNGARRLGGAAGLPDLIGRARLALNGLGTIGGLVPAWLALVVPIYLSARRWTLLQRATILRGGRS